MVCEDVTDALASSSSAARCVSVGSIARCIRSIGRPAMSRLTSPHSSVSRWGARRGRRVLQRAAANSQQDSRKRRAQTRRRRCHRSHSPRTGPKTTAPDRIVIDLKISEQPEQRSDPSISAIAVLPPSASGPTVVPACHRRTSGDPSANIRVAQRGRVAQRAGKRTGASALARRESNVVDGVRPTTAEVRTAAEMPTTMAATTEMCATVPTTVMPTAVMSKAAPAPP